MADIEDPTPNPPYRYQPCLVDAENQMIFGLEIWFDSKEECEDFLSRIPGGMVRG
jgi:hypothetical protein